MNKERKEEADQWEVIEPREGRSGHVTALIQAR